LILIHKLKCIIQQETDGFNKTRGSSIYFYELLFKQKYFALHIHMRQGSFFLIAKVKSQYFKGFKFIKHESPSRNHPLRMWVFIRSFYFNISTPFSEYVCWIFSITGEIAEAGNCHNQWLKLVSTRLISFSIPPIILLKEENAHIELDACTRRAPPF
jgi:hypothetical protein